MSISIKVSISIKDDIGYRLDKNTFLLNHRWGWSVYVLREDGYYSHASYYNLVSSAVKKPHLQLKPGFSIQRTVAEVIERDLEE